MPSGSPANSRGLQDDLFVVRTWALDIDRPSLELTETTTYYTSMPTHQLPRYSPYRRPPQAHRKQPGAYTSAIWNASGAPQNAWVRDFLSIIVRVTVCVRTRRSTVTIITGLVT